MKTEYKYITRSVLRLLYKLVYNLHFTNKTYVLANTNRVMTYRNQDTITNFDLLKHRN